MKTPWLSYLKNKIYSEDYYVQFIGLKSEDSRHPIYWREQSGRECVFPPSRMLLIPESQLAALELRLQGSRVPFGEPQCTSKPSISFQGFITGRYVRLGPTAAHPVASQTASEVGGWTGDPLCTQGPAARLPRAAQWEPVLMAPGQPISSSLLDCLKWRHRKWTGQGQDEEMDSQWQNPQWWTLERQGLRQGPAMTQASYQSCWLTIRGSDVPWTMSCSGNRDGFPYSFLPRSLTLSPHRQV